jgi:hypothetical protein
MFSTSDSCNILIFLSVCARETVAYIFYDGNVDLMLFLLMKDIFPSVCLSVFSK